MSPPKFPLLRYSVTQGVAVILLDNPPVNSGSHILRTSLKNAFELANEDEDVKSIALLGLHKFFMAGADISEFGGPLLRVVPMPILYRQTIDKVNKPIVCGIHGAGGTQRLPRVIGPILAIEYIASGRNIPAAKAKRVGLVDEIVDASGMSAKQAWDALRDVTFQKALDVQGKPFRRVADVKLQPLDPFIKNMLLDGIKKSSKGFKAPLAAARCVIAATESKTFDEGQNYEIGAIIRASNTMESKSLRHVFFAQRQATKVKGVSRKAALPIKSVGIIGAGLMGGGIAMCCVQKGIKVVLIDINQKGLDRGMALINKNYRISVKRGKKSRYQVKKYISMIKPSLNYSDLADVDLVIEAVLENMNVKKKVFKALDEVCKPSCILASNTSTLSIDEMATAVSRPDKFCGMHFFSPANIMPLLENVRGAKSSESTLATAMSFGARIGKTAVMCGNCFGFIGNRMIMKTYAVQGQLCVLEGANPYLLDKVLRKFGFPMGLFQLNDLTGIDVAYHIEQGRKKAPNEPPYIAQSQAALLKLYKAGRYGQKTKKGWYTYVNPKTKKVSRRPFPDNEFILPLIEQVRKELNIRPRKVSDQEIIERMLYSLVNEGFKILEEGIADKPSDIDIVFIFGYGFPPYRGGPMFWADQIGLDKVHAALMNYSKKYPDIEHFKPADLLSKLASKKMTLQKYWKSQK